MGNIFTPTCPNHTGDGAIDNPDQFEDVYEQTCVQEVVENFFTHGISKVRPHKIAKKRPFWPLVKVLVRFYA